jgi:hypothetical protein
MCDERRERGLCLLTKKQEGAVSRGIGVAEYNKRRHSLALWHWGESMRHVKNQPRT